MGSSGPATRRDYAALMTLDPGDVLTTGTPAGTARGAGQDHYLVRWQHVDATIQGLGTQSTPVV